MSALVKLVSKARQQMYLQFQSQEGSDFEMTKNGLGMLFSSPKISALSAKAEIGEDELAGSLKPNRTYQLVFGTINPNKYEVLLSAHPGIYAKCKVSLPAIVPSHSGEHELVLTIEPTKSIDIKDLPWILCLYLID